MTSPYVFRPIERKDNQAVRTLVVETLAEYGLSGPGFAGADPELSDMQAHYDKPRSAYFVIEFQDSIWGCGGFAPLVGNPELAEFQKMYLKPSVRGQGLGHKMVSLCIEKIKASGFKGVYLETVPDMKSAQFLYKKHGFIFLEQRMGNTGHRGCGLFMYKNLSNE